MRFPVTGQQGHGHRIIHFDNFYWDVKEKVNSLLMFDIVQADSSVSNELKKEIQKDGVVIYEKA